MAGVQSLARHLGRQLSVAVKLAVEFVAEQRMADMGHVYPYLMRAAGVQPEF